MVPVSPEPAAAPLTPGPPGPSANVLRMLPWLVAVSLFMESLDTTILATAVPSIADALAVPPLSLKAVMSSYTLSLAVFIPISGWMANRFGTRRVFSGAILVFTVGSLLCGLARNVHLLVACRILQGCGGAMMVPVGRLTLVRAFPKSDLVRAISFMSIPGLIGPMLGPVAGGFITAWLHWSVIFFLNIPIGLVGLYLAWRHLPDFRQPHSTPPDLVGMVLFGSGVALLSYVLEVFGEHSMGGAQIAALLLLAALLLFAYGLHAEHVPQPLLRLSLLRVRTFRTAVTGSYLTRIGIGGMPFLLPLLYQVGLGYTPLQSGLLQMPPAIAAMCLKFLLPGVLARYGFRSILVTNTVLLGVMIFGFATIGIHTPVWLIVLQALVYGFFTSMQYTSMNSLVYADVSADSAGDASTIASTAQQMAISFGVAAASLVTGLFLPDRFHSTAPQMIHGIHLAFLTMGAATLVSSLVFRNLRDGDGRSVSQHRPDGAPA
ncbi:MAG: DHA2 family efflux MFS transporter permease subunit [Proteobacteria bacterium]|nr:DHA2 family efflux MFS transporter permease subunit [Pseudomonadota bacterium]